MSGEASPGLQDPAHAGLADLLARIGRRDVKVGVIGLGYVGIPLALAIARAGFEVLGFDIAADRVAQLNRGESFLKQFPSAVLAGFVAAGRFSATHDFGRLDEPDAILIAVPTPLTRQREPDLSFVRRTAKAIARRLRRGQLVVLESTTWPGTTEEVVRPILERSGLRSGTDFFLAYSPEREDPGNPDYGTASIPKVVGADGPDALALARQLYEAFVVRTVPVSTASAAEAVKLTENIFRAVNIALANELKVIFSRMGIDVWEVIEAAKTKPFGFMPFHPGPGLGGHCIPIDPFYLSWKAREYDVTTRFIELAGEINAAMPSYVVERLTRAVDERLRRGLNGSRILVLGLAYKKNVDDLRESPALRLIEILEERGASVAFHDPYIGTIPPTREYAGLAGRSAVALEREGLARFDAVLIATDHDAVDYGFVVEHARLVVDTRNICRRRGIDSPKVVLA